MRYNIIHQEGVTIIHVLQQNIFFGYDMSDDYATFRASLEMNGIDAFIDLLIEDSNTAFTKFIALNG